MNNRLNEGGEVDYSECADKLIMDKLVDNPYVRICLMEKELLFEIPSEQRRRETGKEVARCKKELERLESLSVQEIEVGLSEAEQKEDSFNLEYEDFIFKEKTNMASHQMHDEDSQLNKQITHSQRLRTQMLEPLLNQISTNLYSLFHSLYIYLHYIYTYLSILSFTYLLYVISSINKCFIFSLFYLFFLLLSES